MKLTIARIARATLGLFALTMTVVACGSDSTSDATGAASGGGVTVSDAWARTSPGGVTTGAAYFTMTSATADALTKVEVDPSVAASAELHETMTGGTDTTAAMASGGGAMSMQPVTKVDLPAGTAVSFAPGGFHVMLMDLKQPLVAGRTFVLTLVFEHAGAQPVTFTVRDDAP